MDTKQHFSSMEEIHSISENTFTDEVKRETIYDEEFMIHLLQIKLDRCQANGDASCRYMQMPH